MSANCAAVNYLRAAELTKAATSHSVTHCSDLCVSYCMYSKFLINGVRRLRVLPYTTGITSDDIM